MQEHEFEPVIGLPGHLPPGEKLLWQGSPRWRGLARYAFHERKLVLYFAILLSWYAIDAVREQDIVTAIISTLWLACLALIAIALVDLFAWLVSKTTVYTITSRRVVMRIGVALPITINIPFKSVVTAGLKENVDGTGDLLLTLSPMQKVSYLLIWPHARPWHLFAAKPLLRAVPNASRAASILSRALAIASAQRVVATETELTPVGASHSAAVPA